MKTLVLPLFLAAALVGCSAAPSIELAEINEAIDNNRLQEARAGLLELRDYEGSSEENSMLLAQVSIDLGDGYAAERYLSEVRDPSNTNWAILQCHALILQGRARRAGEFLTELQGEPPGDGTIDWLHVWIAMEEGEAETAEAIVDAALRQHPQSAPLHAKAARLSMWRLNWDAARRHVDEALEADPNNYEAQTILGESQIAEGEQEAALLTYQAVSQSHPDFAIPRANTVGLLLDLGRLDEAEIELNSALQDHPDFALLLFNAARLQSLKGNWDLARGTVQALPNDWKRDHPAARLLEGEIEAALGNYTMARTIYMQLADDPRFEQPVEELLAALPRED